jgi:cleavage and polyadenylation specificity factor subunit 1
VSPITWEIVDKYALDEAEQGFCLDCMNLESQQTATGRKDFMVIGTGYLKGEDTAMRGRVSMIFDCGLKNTSVLTIVFTDPDFRRH